MIGDGNWERSPCQRPGPAASRNGPDRRVAIRVAMENRPKSNIGTTAL